MAATTTWCLNARNRWKPKCVSDSLSNHEGVQGEYGAAMPREREATSIQNRNHLIHARGRRQNGIRQMRSTSTRPLEHIHNLRVNCAGDRRAPHKPLLLLYALGQLRRGRREIPFNDVKSALDPLLDAYAPPVLAILFLPTLNTNLIN